MKFHIVGIDSSLTGTGLARIRIDSDTYPRADIAVDVIGSKPVPDAKPRHTLARIRDLTRRIVLASRIDREEGDVVIYAIETPIYPAGKSLGMYHTRAGLWWLIFHLIEKEGLVVFIEPTKLKKYATGKGNAPKDLIFSEVVRAFPHVGVVDNNEADALGLASMVARELGHSVEQSVQRVDPSVLDGVDWPAEITEYRLENLSGKKSEKNRA